MAMVRAVYGQHKSWEWYESEVEAIGVRAVRIKERYKNVRVDYEPETRYFVVSYEEA